jgi:Ni/Co efflux regulator RcnB
MKRLILTIAALASVAGPMAMTATDASAQNRGGQYQQRDNNRQGDNRQGDHRYDNNRYDNRGGQNYRPQPQRPGSWDNNRYNGYYYNNSWRYGAPPVAYYNSPAYRPGYQAWRRGGYLPPSYRTYVVRDYGRYGLRAPPRGYYWYQSGNDYLLAAIATGLIFDIVTR